MKHLLPLKYIEAIAKHGSIRKAAEHLAITPSALNRRLMSMEDELEVQLFERLAKGVRLNAAGELMLEHIRHQISDMERVKSRIADLAGMRKGHVSLGCSLEITSPAISRAIHKYQSAFPNVTFEISSHDKNAIMNALSDHEIDLAIVYEPEKLVDFQTVYSLHQPMICCIPPDNPLAERDRLRLYECLGERASVPSLGNGVRDKLERSAARLGLGLDRSIMTNSHSMQSTLGSLGGYLQFDLPINHFGNPVSRQQVAVRIDERDVEPGFIFVGHLRGRALPVAAARFMEDIVEGLAATEARDE